MATTLAYHRPATIDQALSLLGSPGAVVLGGATKVNAGRTRPAVVAVDLQGLHLDCVERLAGGPLLIGASVTLQDLVEGLEIPDGVREAARREQPSTIRSAATVGGCLATGDPTSELVATFLVHDASVRVAGPDGARTLALTTLLADRGRLAGRIITAVTIDTGGVTASARTGRTRADRAIVAAVARRTADGGFRLALTGVAASPVLVAAGDPLDHLRPPGDFRGSTHYRLALAGILSARAVEAVR